MRQNSCTKFDSKVRKDSDKKLFNVHTDQKYQERASFLSNRTTSMRANKRGSDKLKRGTIFKTTDKLKFIEAKGAFRDLINQNSVLNDHLQDKLNYYYTPYMKKNMNTENYLINFSKLREECENNDKNDENFK